MTTLDSEWTGLGRPLVSCIKLDIEGAEMRALQGGRELMQTMHPYVFLEWYEENFRVFGNKSEDLLKASDEFEYEVVSLPNLNVIRTLPLLLLQISRTASFVLVPRAACRQ